MEKETKYIVKLCTDSEIGRDYASHRDGDSYVMHVKCSSSYKVSSCSSVSKSVGFSSDKIIAQRFNSEELALLVMNDIENLVGHKFHDKSYTMVMLKEEVKGKISVVRK